MVLREVPSAGAMVRSVMVTTLWIVALELGSLVLTSAK
jgi:hypothetical protein